MHPDSWRSDKGWQHCYPRLFTFPYPNPDNTPGIGWHDPGQAVTPADLCGRSEEGQPPHRVIRNQLSCDWPGPKAAWLVEGAALGSPISSIPSACSSCLPPPQLCCLCCHRGGVTRWSVWRLSPKKRGKKKLIEAESESCSSLPHGC